MPKARLAVLPGSNRPPAAGAKLIKRSIAGEKIEISIYLRSNPRSRTGYDLAQEALKPPSERRYLRGAAFDRVYGADPRELKKVESWARRSKLTILDSSVAKRRVRIQGRIEDVEKAFGTELNEYRHADHGSFRGRAGALHVPTQLDGIVEGVFGLDTRKLGRSRRRRAPRAARRAKRDPFAKSFRGSFFPPELAVLYEFPPKLDGHGQNIAVFAFNGSRQDDDNRGGYNRAALTTYFEQVLGSRMPYIDDVIIMGPGNVPGPDTERSANAGDTTGEVMLDLCILGALAPAARLHVYFTEFTSRGWVDALHEAITDSKDNSVISISYGNPERDPEGLWTGMAIKVVDTAMKAASAKGVTICVASGDDGSSDAVRGSKATADFPGSSPHVLSVGGTKLTATTDSRQRIRNETVWNEGRHSAGGGGVSAIFDKPQWQRATEVPLSAEPPHRSGRGLPDVAALADPQTGIVVMHVNGKKVDTIGGTSAAAPLWAALIARLNHGLSARCGFLNPFLYEKLQPGVLRDIIRGDNGAYVARKGWDPCTGLGTPRGRALLRALAGSSKKPYRARRKTPKPYRARKKSTGRSNMARRRA